MCRWKNTINARNQFEANQYKKLLAGNFVNDDVVNPGNPGHDVWVPRTNRFQQFDFENERNAVNLILQYEVNESLEFMLEAADTQFDRQKYENKTVVDFRGRFIRF